MAERDLTDGVQKYGASRGTDVKRNKHGIRLLSAYPRSKPFDLADASSTAPSAPAKRATATD